MYRFGHLEPHTISNQQRPIMKKIEKIKSKSNFWNQQRSIMKKQKNPVQIQIQLLESTKANYEKIKSKSNFWAIGCIWLLGTTYSRQSTKANYEKTEKNPILGIFLLIWLKKVIHAVIYVEFIL